MAMSGRPRGAGRIRGSGFAVLIASGLVACGGDGSGPLIVIDGEFGDWDAVPPALVDSTENGPGAVDFGEIRVESDDDAVYFAIDFGRTVNHQAMQGAVTLAFDTDDDPFTGTDTGDLEGVDLSLVFSPMRLSGGAVGQGVAVSHAGEESGDAYGIGVYVAPTFASRYTELRIDRSAFTGDTLRARLSYSLADGEIGDRTDVFRVPLRRSSGHARRLADVDAVRRAPGTALRVLSWNVSDLGPIEAPDAFSRLITGLAPDVILFDEVSRDIDASWFADRFAELDGEWTIVRGMAGGRQTTLAASRFPVRPVLERIEYADSILVLIGEPSTPQLQQDLLTGISDAMPALAVAIDVDGRQILMVTTDLQCCGHAGSSEDRARWMMADRIRDAVAEAIASASWAGVIVAGDFNLVGSRAPLDIIGAALDPAGADLEPAFALRLDGASTATWRSPGPFPPGRLDFVLYSTSSLDVLRAFPFAVEDLAPSAVRSLALDAEDSRVVSDHLPVIVDFAIRR